MKKTHFERRKAMESMGNKKLALLYILKILEEYSDSQHPLTQSDLAEKLESQYGVVLERKAISRNLSLLREAGYEVESTAKGNYLDQREFENAELRLMIDGVLGSRYVTPKGAKDLAERIAGLANKHFRSHVKHIHSVSSGDKTLNPTVFYGVELIDEAIEAGLQVSFDYYGFDKDLNLSQQRRVTLSPMQMVVKNQFYYVIGTENKLSAKGPRQVVGCYRLDLLSNPIIEDEKAVCQGTNFDAAKEFIKTHPYMHSFGVTPKHASFLCYQQDLNLVVETLGTDIRVQPLKPRGCEKGEKIDPTAGLVKVSLKIDLNELVEFACRYPQKIFLVFPECAVAHQKALYETHGKLLDKMKNYIEK